MKTSPSLLLGFAGIIGILSFSISASAAVTPRSVTISGKIYYVIDGNNPSLNSANRVCAAVGKKFVALVTNTTVCKALHPTASVSTIMDGAPYGFFCNGAPQTDRACSTRRNACAICTACNKANVNADTQIGTQFAEMYVDCGQSSSTAYKVPPMPPKSSSSKSSSSSLAPIPGLTCAFKQGKPGALVRASCNVAGAAGNYCNTVMPGSKATGCAKDGNVVCTMPCTLASYILANFKRCPFGATTTAPTGSCPKASSSSAATGRTVSLGGLCKTQADCNDSDGKGGQLYVYCVGHSPDTRCSCSPNTQTTGGCQANYANTKNQPTGAGCVHGGNCKSGVCLGPGPVYHCQ